MKNVYYAILISIGFMFSILLISSCSEESNLETTLQTISEDRPYLVIKDLSHKFDQNGKLQLTSEDKQILFEAFSRISKNARNEKGKIDLSSMSAESLNIDSFLFDISFNFLAPYIRGEKVVGGRDKLYISRLKTGSESGGNSGDDGGFSGGGGGGLGMGGSGIGDGGSIDGGGGSIGGGGGSIGGGSIGGGVLTEDEMEEYILSKYSKNVMFELICNQGDLSPFERKCFSQFWYARGDMELSEEEWKSIKKCIDSTGYKNGRVYDLETIKYYVCTISFYDEPEYDYAFGSATVTFLEGGTPLALYDVYDFNIWAKRDFISEGITISINVLGRIYGAKEYKIHTQWYLT